MEYSDQSHSDEDHTLNRRRQHHHHVHERSVTLSSQEESQERRFPLSNENMYNPGSGPTNPAGGAGAGSGSSIISPFHAPPHRVHPRRRPFRSGGGQRGGSVSDIVSTSSSSSSVSSSDSLDDREHPPHAGGQMFFSRTSEGFESGADSNSNGWHGKKRSSLFGSSPFDHKSPWELPDVKSGEAMTTEQEGGSRDETDTGGDTNVLDRTPSTMGERMNYEVVEDPRHLIINMIIDSPTGSVELADIMKNLKWELQYEKAYGSIAEYLQGYHSIFVVSPIYDRVTLCRPVISSLKKSERRRHRNRKQTEGELVAAHIGSISCSCVAEGIDIEEMQSLYRRMGYETEIQHNVLHVCDKNVFDLFVFENGVVVWWGMKRSDHWIVEDYFFVPRSSAWKALKGPFSHADINALFPNWSSYEADSNYLPLKLDEKAAERFSKMLCFDHYVIPAIEPDRTHVMLTVSFCIGRSACVDYYEHVTQSLHQRVLSIPLEFSGILEYFSTQNTVRHLEGELQVTQLALATLKDTPDFLWEMPWLQIFYDLTELQCTSEQRLSWFGARGDALLENLSNIKNRRFRLFMLGSDVFLIGLLIFDVVFMTARLIVKLYFKVED